MITYISDPHSKIANHETKLNETKTYSSTVLFDASYSKTCNRLKLELSRGSLGNKAVT